LSYWHEIDMVWMFRKKLTFLLVPDTSQLSRQMSVRVWYLWAGLASAVLFVFATFFFASAFLSGEVDKAELERLQTENQTLAGKYEALCEDLEKTNSRFSEVVEKEIAIRQAFGLPEVNLEERQLGIGGPASLNPPLRSETEWLAYNTEAEVDRLLRLSAFELEKYSEMESGLGDLKDRLDHTPSIWPTRGWLQSGFGMRTDPFTGTRRLHRGVDVSNNTGSPIIASAAGRVQSVRKDRELGRSIVIEHDYGFVTRYGHLSQIDVVRGQKIERGDVIGRMGSTGRSTGPHLHYEVWCNGNVLNPLDYILDEM
jgi:murein DD-endopeptidase MepM/ murein hydrolase activator NlpD